MGVARLVVTWRDEGGSTGDRQLTRHQKAMLGRGDHEDSGVVSGDERSSGIGLDQSGLSSILI